jgi:hypothetical protein
MAEMQPYIRTLRNVAVKKLKLYLSPKYEHAHSHMLIMQHSKKLYIKLG